MFGKMVGEGAFGKVRKCFVEAKMGSILAFPEIPSTILMSTSSKGAPVFIEKRKSEIC
jgi:hypothetical protein